MASPQTERVDGEVARARHRVGLQAKGEHVAELLSHLKKSEMAQEAERILADSDWLPEPLRAPEERGTQVEELQR